MRILPDTCEFLWLVSGDLKLAAAVASAVRDPQNEVLLNAVSSWEVCRKHSLGKLPLPEPPEQFVPSQRQADLITPLVLDGASVARLTDLPALHRGSFDRTLVCQAQSHGLALASSDPLLRRFPVALI